MVGVVGCPAYIPQWGENCVIVGFCIAQLSYTVIMPNGDEAFIPIHFLEVLH